MATRLLVLVTVVTGKKPHDTSTVPSHPFRKGGRYQSTSRLKEDGYPIGMFGQWFLLITLRSIGKNALEQ